MAKEIRPQTNYVKFVAFAERIIKALTLFIFLTCVICGSYGHEKDQNISNSGGDHLIQSIGVHKGERKEVAEEKIYQDSGSRTGVVGRPLSHGYQSNFSTTHRRKKSGRRKRLREKKYQAGGKTSRFLNETNSEGYFWNPNASNNRQDEKNVLARALFRTSHDDRERGMLIQSIVTNSTPAMRYYQSFPVRSKERKRPPPPEIGKIFILANAPTRSKHPHYGDKGWRNETRQQHQIDRPDTPRYENNYLNWKGLKYGKLLVISYISFEFYITRRVIMEKNLKVS